MTKTVKLYQQLFAYFMSKPNKMELIKRYANASLIRGGTFWGEYVLRMTINASLILALTDGSDMHRVVASIPLTYLAAQLTFMPIGIAYGLLRELFFDYESSKHRA